MSRLGCNEMTMNEVKEGGQSFARFYNFVFSVACMLGFTLCIWLNNQYMYDLLNWNQDSNPENSQ